MSADGLSILDFRPDLAGAFRDLNVEWLEKYFTVEAVDREILENPVRDVIEAGGAILFAEQGGSIVGTVALRHHGNGVYELTKMAVTERCQGAGIGRRLLTSVIDRYRALAGTTLYLESHSSLEPAIRLYESAGFSHEPPPAPSMYRRADVYMRLTNK